MSIRELKLIDIMDVFVPDRIQGKVRITKSEPVIGELLCDSAGFWFLTPEEDYRGGIFGAIRVHNLPSEAMHRYRNKLVKVAGIFEGGEGLTVEAIVLDNEPFD